MAVWAKGTHWRQGHVLTDHSAHTLELTRPDGNAPKVVVISHDCDIESDESIEPVVEVIVGRIVASGDGNYLSARSARTLHLPYDKARAARFVEMRATDRLQIDKSVLAGHSPDASMPLAPDDKYTLQSWLASRYFRAAFPTAFVDRFGKHGLGLDEPFRKILSNVTQELAAVYFDLDSGEDNERDATSVYVLSIYLVAKIEPDPEKTKAACAKAKEKIEKLFKDKCALGAGWSGIELEGCYLESVSTVTLAVASQLRKWNADYLSLRLSPQDHPIA